MSKGYLVLESGECFEGAWVDGMPDGIFGKAGEVVFNTSHAGYEEIATDPSYFSQIIVMTAVQMGNYGEDPAFWESRKIWIEGFVCLDLQESKRDQSWKSLLHKHRVPILKEVDTRSLVLRLRDFGTPWGAIVKAETLADAKKIAMELIEKKKQQPEDWVALVSRQKVEKLIGENPKGPRVAVLDYGVKENTLRELKKFCSEVAVFPSRSSAQEVLDYKPAGVLLSNGPGDPAKVEVAVETVKGFIGKLPVFGICMGHQILSLALGAKTYKLKFGHRGGNHPVKDKTLNLIYMTSQNHGYAVEDSSLPAGVQATHINLNDNTIEGISCPEKICWSVQFHPESHPGPRESRVLFDYFAEKLK